MLRPKPLLKLKLSLSAALSSAALKICVCAVKLAAKTSLTKPKIYFRKYTFQKTASLRLSRRTKSLAKLINKSLIFQQFDLLASRSAAQQIERFFDSVYPTNFKTAFAAQSDQADKQPETFFKIRGQCYLCE